jgi:hypothetical protein
MKKLLLIIPLIALTGCTELKPFGGENSVQLNLPGPADLAASAMLDRLPDGLLVTIKVLDDQLVADPEKPLWDSDSIEFYADLRPYRERELLNGYARGVFQLIVRPPAGDAPMDWSLKSYGFPVPEGIRVSSVRTASGYTVQFFLPEKSFREIHGPFRDTLYVDVAVNNVDADGRNEKIFWKGNGDNWQHPHNFQPVTLP